jgi:hypothetical protein
MLHTDSHAVTKVLPEPTTSRMETHRQWQVIYETTLWRYFDYRIQTLYSITILLVPLVLSCETP